MVLVLVCAVVGGLVGRVAAGHFWVSEVAEAVTVTVVGVLALGPPHAVMANIEPTDRHPMVKPRYIGVRILMALLWRGYIEYSGVNLLYARVVPTT